MNKSETLNLLLAVALVILAVKVAFFSKENINSNGKLQTEDIIIKNLMSRTSIRAYQDKPIEDQKIEKILRAAMAAPSAGNKQPWRYIVIKEKKTLEIISENFNTMKMVKDAPLAVVVCGDMNDTFPSDGRDYWVEDASAATENLLLAAHAMGLGAVWCGIYPMQERVKYLKELLGMPENIIPLNVVPIGYPAEDPAPKDKWKPENIHYERWIGNSANIPQKTNTQWQKIAPKELHINPFTLFSDAMALTVGKKEEMNSMTIGWGSLGILWGHERPIINVYVEKRRHTLSLMDKNDYFTVTAFSKDYAKVLKYLGTASGRNEDKIKGSGLTLKYTELGTPAFEEGQIILECRKIYSAWLNPDGFGDIPQKEYANRPLHKEFVGEIVNAWIKTK